MINTLFSESVVTLIATPNMWEGKLYPEEEAIVKGVSDKRLREFTAGRVGARTVLQQLEVHNYPLVANINRTPIWPENIKGSISHKDDQCVVVATADPQIYGVGVDVEINKPLDWDVASVVCTEQELEWIAKVINSPGNSWSTLIFSAKESLYKALSSVVDVYIDFKDVQITFNVPHNMYYVELINKALADLAGGYQLHGKYATAGQFIYTGLEVIINPESISICHSG